MEVGQESEGELSEGESVLGSPMVEIMVASHLGDDGRPCGANHLGQLVPELFELIVQHLDGRSLIALGSTSRQLQQRVDHKKMWERVLLTEFPGIDAAGADKMSSAGALRRKYVAVLRSDLLAVHEVRRAAVVRQQAVGAHFARHKRSLWLALIYRNWFMAINSGLAFIFLLLVMVRVVSGDGRLSFLDCIPFILFVAYGTVGFCSYVSAYHYVDGCMFDAHARVWDDLERESCCATWVKVNAAVTSVPCMLFFWALVVAQAVLLVARWSTMVTWSYWYVFAPLFTYWGLFALLPLFSHCTGIGRSIDEARRAIAYSCFNSCGTIVACIVLVGIHLVSMAVVVALETERAGVDDDGGSVAVFVFIPSFVIWTCMCAMWTKDMILDGELGDESSRTLMSIQWFCYLSGNITLIVLVHAQADVNLGWAFIPYLVGIFASFLYGLGGKGMCIDSGEVWREIKDHKGECCLCSCNAV